MKYKLKVISPLSIGGDTSSTLIHGKDFIVQDGKLTGVESTKVFASINANTSVSVKQVNDFAGEWAANIINSIGIADKESVKKFSKALAELTGLQFNEISYSIELSENETITGTTQIKNICTSPSGAYIPGSSLKGAIETALLFDYFLYNPRGKATWKKKCDELKTGLEVFFRLSEDETNTKDKKEKRRIGEEKEQKSAEIYSCIREINKQQHDTNKSIFCFTNIVSRPGRNGKSEDVRLLYNSNNLRVSDSEVFDKEAIGVYQAGRYHLNASSDNIIPLASKALKAGAEQTIELDIIQIEPDDTQKYVYALMTSNSPWELLRSALSNWSLKCIEADEQFIREAESKEQWVQEYLIQLGEMRKQLQENVGEAIFRLGQGKGMFYSSLAPLIFACDKALYQLYCRYFLGSKPENIPAPVTRVLTFINHTMPGWVSMSPAEL